ncbi:transposase [Desulfuromonas carbonis]|uniref:REP-associated tyrosine transposase n=1 Tax=Desulfuromonas sp. DDH964 TaxID=1823759 RepID=UPI00078C4F9F|nr:transposase [Desulfuromonas sp. DDH964]AMV73076.1 transposase [Desulfuromonas sp. DDH964]
MGRPLRIEYPGAFYHVTARGNEQREIYKSVADRERFLGYLASATERYGAAVHVWCLMTNHYHLLLETPEGNLSRIMRHINGAYTNYFNTKRRRAGHLFQGRYKAILVDRDAYALELSRYIHLNPVRAGMSLRPEEYAWSSYRNYVGQQVAPGWLRREEVLGYFGGDETRYQGFVEEGLKAAIMNPLDEALASTILGGEKFVQEITALHLSGVSPNRDLPGIQQLNSRWSIDDIVAAVEATLGAEKGLSRSVAIYLCHRHSGARLREIGERFGVGESAVSQGSRRTREKVAEEEGLRVRVERICQALGIVNV